MKISRLIMFMLAISYISACAQTNDNLIDEENKGATGGTNNLVGGACSYDKYSGECEITSLSSGVSPKFLYSGMTGSGEQRIEGNELTINVIASDPYGTIDRTQDGIATALGLKLGNKYACELWCIKTGTCTPSMFEFSNLSNDTYRAYGGASAEASYSILCGAN